MQFTKKKKMPEPELISYYYLVNLKNLGGLKPPPPLIYTPVVITSERS